MRKVLVVSVILFRTAAVCHMLQITAFHWSSGVKECQRRHVCARHLVRGKEFRILVVFYAVFIPNIFSISFAVISVSFDSIKSGVLAVSTND